jgi:hypothetical protein
MNSDTTHLHHSHLYDANCGICKKNNLQKFAEKERLEKLEAKMEAKVKHYFSILILFKISAQSRRGKKWKLSQFGSKHPCGTRA